MQTRSLSRLLIAIATFLLSAPSALAVEADDLPAILDAPNLSFSIENDGGALLERDTAIAFSGDSSLAVRPVIEPNEQRPTINFSLTMPVAGPGRFTCRARVTGANLGLFNVNGHGAYELLPDGHQEGTWYRLTFPILSFHPEITFAMWPFLDNENAVFHFDEFRFEPGVVFTTQDLPDAGAITLSPNKDFYAVGETVTVSLSSPHPAITPYVTQIDAERLHETERPATFQVAAERDLTFLASYQQALDFGSFKGSATLADSIIDPADPAGFSFSRLVLTDLPGNTLLAFELAPAARSTVVLSGGSPIPRAEITQPANEGSPLAYLAQALDFEQPVAELAFETGSTWWGPRPAAIRNLRLATATEIVPQTSGSGSVAIHYEPGPSLGSTLASLTATPDEGWSFLRWEGFATSESPSLDVLINRPRTITAVFGQEFQLGPSRWAFAPTHSAHVTRTEDGHGFRIEANSLPALIQYEATVHRNGPLSARAYVYEADGETLAYTQNALPHPQTISKAPQTVSYFLSLWDKPIVEIRDFVVSGGSGYNDTTLSIHAPAGSVTLSPDQTAYPLGEAISLSVAESYRDRFLAWTGDVYSVSPELSFVLEEPTRITALFRQSWTSDGGRELSNTGSHLLPAPSNLADLAFPATSLAPGAWTELHIEKGAHLVVGLAFDPASDYMEPAAFVGDRELQGAEKWLRDGIWYLQSMEVSDEPLRLRFTNGDSATKQFSIKRIAFYSDANAWFSEDESGLGGGSVKIEPDQRFHEIGATVSLDPLPNGGFAFKSWGATTPAPLENATFIVPDDGKVRIRPEFEFATPIPGLSFLPRASFGWSANYGESPGVSANALLEGDETLLLALETQGPGVLAFSETYASFHDQPLHLEVSVNGSPARFGNFHVTNYAHDREALLPAGVNRVEIAVSLTEVAKKFGASVNNLKLLDFQFLRGYAISYSSDFPHPPKVAPQNWPSVYPAGSSVTVSPDFVTGETFGNWTGDLSQYSTASIALKLDRHIIANPKPATDKKAGVLTANVSENAIFTSGSNGPNNLDYTLFSSSGPTRFAFEIPAMTELSLETLDATGPIEARANGVVAYQGDPGNVVLTFPVKEGTQRIELFLELDPQASAQTRVIASAYQRFFLTGAFGASQEYVIPDPRKDDYAPGDKVTIKLGNGINGSHVFYDIVAAYPSLNQIEWLDVEGQKSFEVEMASHVTLLGRAGPPPSRTIGQIVAGPGLALNSSQERAPDNRTVQLGRLDGLNEAPYLRIATNGARHIDFWIQAPPQLDIVFSEIEVDGLPLTIEGNGLWQKASLAVPAGQKYLSAFLISDHSAPESFHISSVNTMKGYGIQYLVTGNADLRTSPANGAASPASSLALTLVPASGYHLGAWNDIAETPLERTLKPSDSRFLLPVIEKDPVTLSSGGLAFLLHNAELLPDATGARLATDGASLSAPVTGPGRIAYQSDFSGFGSLEVRVDGARYLPGDFFRQPHMPGQPTVPIPVGVHQVEFVFTKSRSTSDGSLSLSDINFEPGVYLLPEPYTANGAIQVTPAQTFVPLGNTVTVSVQPHPGYVFHGWTDDLANAPQRSPYSFVPKDHIRFDAAFRRDETYLKDGLEWKVVSEARAPDFSTLAATLQGPGFVRISYHIAQDPDFAAYLDEQRVHPVPEDFQYYLPVPAGSHQLRLQANSSASFYQAAVDYLTGYLVLLTGDAEALQVSPKQQSYLRGAQLNLSLDPRALGPADLRYRVGDHILGSQQAIELTIDRHTVLPVRRIEPFVGTEFQTDGTHSKLQASQGPAGLQFTIAGPVFDTLSLYRELHGPATLSFQLEQLRDWEVRLFVDDELALSYREPASPELKIPPGPHTLRWDFRTLTNVPVDPSASLSNIQTATTQLSSFEQWMASLIPASRFAAGAHVGPEQDLDDDGFSNAEEWARSTPPHRFDFTNLLIQPRAGQLRLTLELPSLIDPASVSLILFDPPLWKRQPLATLDYQSSPSENGAWRHLSIPIDVPLANSRLLQIELSNPSAGPSEN